MKTETVGKMTEEQAVKILAEREGWSDVRPSQYYTDVTLLGSPPSSSKTFVVPLPNYFSSRDALRPVLERLTSNERTRVVVTLERDYPGSGEVGPDDWVWYFLTLPPKTLAFAIAEAISKD